MGKRKKRPNQYGTVEKRGDGWLARWYIFDEFGNRRRKSRMLETTGNEDDAYAELKTITERDGLVTREKLKEREMRELQDIRERIEEIDEDAPAMPLSEMFEAFRSSPHRSQRAGSAMLDHYEGQFALFVKWVEKNHPGVTECRHVTQEVADAYAAHLAATVSANTYNKHINLLRSVWRVAGDAARCRTNPWNQKRKTVDVNRREVLTQDEILSIFGSEAVTGEMRLLIALGIYSGLRLGDCATLDWREIDMGKKVIVTVPRKTAKHRTVVSIPILPEFKAILEEVPATKRKGYVVPGIAEEYTRDTGNVTKRIQKIFAGAGLETKRSVEGHQRAVPVRSFHSLRHTFVSLMGNAGVPFAIVKAIVGHVSEEMTARYFHENTDAARRAMANFPTLGIVGAKPGPSEAATATKSSARLDALLGAIGDIQANGGAEEIAEAVKILGAKIEELRECNIASSTTQPKRTQGAKNGHRSARRVLGA